jgi:hypothetical protein
LYGKSDGDTDLKFLNFTSCHLSSAATSGGTALYFNTHWAVTILYLSVVACSESAAIQDVGTNPISIEFANFYQNTVTATNRGLLQVAWYGMALTRCIFSGNACNDRELWFESPISPFFVNDCVFTDGFPSLGTYPTISGTRNVGLGPVTSFPLPLLDVADCPHARDVPFATMTATASFTASSVFTKSPTFSPSHTPSPTPVATRGKGVVLR